MSAIEQRLHELRQIGKRYAEAKARKEYLDHFRKSQLAILKKKFAMVKAGSSFLFPTDAAQDREARADDEYLTTLEGLKAATEEAEALYWELRIAMEGIGIWRTKQASERAERGGYAA